MGPSSLSGLISALEANGPGSTIGIFDFRGNEYFVILW
jgi:hypothetical protein